MLDYEKNSSIGQHSVLAALWFINILIVVFGAPFLIYKKLAGIFIKPVKKVEPKPDKNAKSAQYFPCRVDSKL